MKFFTIRQRKKRIEGKKKRLHMYVGEWRKVLCVHTARVMFSFPYDPAIFCFFLLLLINTKCVCVCFKPKKKEAEEKKPALVAMKLLLLFFF
jgi:hypothetical protein